MYPNLVWPMVALAVIQLVDGLLCLRPLDFVARCLTNVGFPRRYWPLLSPLKFAAAVGLVAGIWVRWLGLVTTIALVVYFVIAIAMHVRAHDLSRDLFVNATGMLLICAATLVWCFLV